MSEETDKNNTKGNIKNEEDSKSSSSEKIKQNCTLYLHYITLHYNLLGDESLPLLDILTLMRCIERDVILVHGINDVIHLLELTESFIRYMISMSEETDKNNTKGNIKNEEDCKSSSSEKIKQN